MSYTVEITLVDPPGPESERGLPTYQLPESFDTIERAREAAAQHIAGLEGGPGGVLFDILDRHGVTIAAEAAPLQAPEP